MAGQRDIKNAPDPLAAAAAMPPLPKLRFNFTIPEKCRFHEEDPHQITLQLLTLEQELQGEKLGMAKGNPFAKVAFALCAVDGRQLDWARGERERAIDTWSPKCRDLLLDAYKHLHSTSKEEQAAFLGTMAPEVS